MSSAGTDAHSAGSGGRHATFRAQGTHETGRVGTGGGGGGDSRGASHGRASDNADDFEPLRLRPYVSLPDSDDLNAPAGSSPTAADEPDGGLFGPDGPLRWTLVDEIWGPNERTSRTDAAERPDETTRAFHPGEDGGPAAGGEQERPEDPGAPNWPGRPDGPRLKRPQPDGPVPQSSGSGATASAAPAESASFASTRRSDFFRAQHPYGRAQAPGDGDLADGAGAVADAPRPGGAPRPGRSFGSDDAVATGHEKATDYEKAEAGRKAARDGQAGDDAEGRSPSPGGPVGSAAAGAVGPTRSVTVHSDGSAAVRSAADAHVPYELFEPDLPDDPGAAPPPDEEPPSDARTRRLGLLVATGVAVAVTVVALIVSGVFASKKPAREAALPDSDAGTSAPADPDTVTSSSQPEADAPPASRRPSAPSTAGTAGGPDGKGQNRTAVPAPPPPQASPTAGTGGSAGGHTPPVEQPPAPPVLHPGDKGPEVKELQLRLRQLLLYLGIANGEYDNGLKTAVANYQNSRDITGDEDGVYGPATRHTLESETKEP